MTPDLDVRTAPAADALRRLAEDYWQDVLERDPVTATFYGDNRYNHLLPEVGPERRAAEDAALRDLVARLEGIPRERLSADDAVTWDMLHLSAQATLDTNRLRLDELAVDQMDGPQVWLPDLLNWHPTDSVEGLESLTLRYRAFPRFMSQYLQNLQDGVRDGRTAPDVAVDRVVGQLKKMLETPPEEATLALPAKELPPKQRQALVEAIAEEVYPAFGRMLEFLGGEYQRTLARKDPGIWSVRDGDEIYTTLTRQHTTTTYTPEELHQIGRDELATIQAEMRAIMARLGDGSGSIRQFTERLIADPSNQPASREQIVQESHELMEKARGLLPRAFGRLPKTPCVVKPVEDYREKDSVGAFYYPPSADGSRPGVFYVNTYEPQSRPRNNLPSLVIHEGVPGHHLQIAIGQEAPDLPTFRRLAVGWLTNAYVEGWALYTERLADELGFYPDDRARFGMLGGQAWRASRLVVDTGLHRLRWDRQQAIDFFLDNVGISDIEVINEIDRYIIWPGQALSYLTGAREIRAIRRDVEQRLGARFDLRGFHDELLVHGAVPLSTLRRTLTTWASAADTGTHQAAAVRASAGG